MPKIQITCTYNAPLRAEWAARINQSFHPPHAQIDGLETQLKWSESTEIEVASEHALTLEVYFQVFDMLRVCGAQLEIEPLGEGDVCACESRVELADRYLHRGHLARVHKQ